MFSLPRRQSTSALPSPATPAPSTRKPAFATLHPSDCSVRYPSPIVNREQSSPSVLSSKTDIVDKMANGEVAPGAVETTRQHSVSMLRSIRSLHPDAHLELSQRSLSRDFTLPTETPTVLAHESCSSLKDQFLRIKERFSSPSPPKNSAPATPTSQSQPQTPRIAPNPATQCVDNLGTPKSAVVIREESAVSLETSVSSTVSPSSTLKDKDDTKTDCLKQPSPRVERWYMEENYFKGVITCWTMEKGAAIVARIARIAANDSGSSLLSSTGKLQTSSNAINPDVSLQWIGQQVWTVTVALPLSRVGELTEDHIALAHQIDKAIATEEEIKPSAQPGIEEDRCSPDLVTDSAASQQLQPPASTLPDVNGPFGTRSYTCARIDQMDAPHDPTTNCQDGSDGVTQPVSVPDKTDEKSPTGSANVDESSASIVSSDASAVASLPLSWSMLSLSSLHSSSDNIRNSTTGSTGTCEEDMSAYPRCVTPSKMGWLKKKSGLNSWQARYFELKGNRLYYFTNETDGIPRGAVVLEHAHVVRGKGDQAMAFSISSSSTLHSLQIIKFTSRLTHQVHSRKSIVLRVVEETEHAASEWVTALNRASFYCNLAATSPSPSSSFVYQSRAFPSPGNRKRKTAFSRFRSPSASAASLTTPPPIEEESGAPHMLEGLSVHHLGSVKYLQDTDPLLWEINPIDQLAIRKRASQARTKSDYLSIFAKYATTFAQIYLPRPRPISLEQTLRDILPELFLINDTLYGGGDGENNGLENIFEVLDTHIKKFASAQEERVRAVSALLQACARTISGGDSYFVVHSLLGNPSMILRPAEARGHPIEISVSDANPSHFLITVFSAFSFHHIDDVENFEEAGSNMTPEPLLRVRTYHIQEFDFSSGKSTRWLKIHTDGVSEDSGGGGGPGGTSGAGSSTNGGGRLNGLRSPWGKYREGAETRIGALLDALS